MALDEELGEHELAEEIVPFDRELSIIAVRGRDGETRFWPLAENVHRDGILRISRSPAVAAPQAEAEELVRRLLEELDYVGVLALELFEVDGRLLANEFAPRVHNTGHWTIDGAVTSQFENHLRAILGLPLGSTDAVAPAVMLNLIGGAPASEKLLELPGAHLHLYGKAPRPGPEDRPRHAGRRLGGDGRRGDRARRRIGRRLVDLAVAVAGATFDRAAARRATAPAPLRLQHPLRLAAGDHRPADCCNGDDRGELWVECHLPIIGRSRPDPNLASSV